MTRNASALAKIGYIRFIPKSLHGRFLLIIIISTLIVQLVSIYVFYYTHLDVVSKHMARSVVAEMLFIKKSIGKPGYDNLLQELTNNTGLQFSFEGKSKLKNKKIADSNWRKNQIYQYVKPLIDPYNRFKSELENYKLTPYEIFQNTDDSDLITVKVQTNRGILSFEVPIKKITSSTSYVFSFWMVFTTLITSLISFIFFKNQIRNIKTLSNIAEKFGRGQDAPALKPSGSKEIRSLMISFMKMRERVERQISQRTDMLSAVSHDLRTPLTRMKLQLTMMEPSEEVKDLLGDISDMERLVEEYLDFARGDDKEGLEKVKILDFLRSEIIFSYLRMNKSMHQEIVIDPSFEMTVKKLSLKRALNNLIDNAFSHGSKVWLSASLSSKNLIILLDDNGPGIPVAERSNVFKPFYRLDNARNLDRKNNSGGSGLGLSIAIDAITSHGGRIRLTESIHGGLRVIISIPF